MIYCDEIFNRAFNLFDDCDISRKYYYDRAGFQQDMLDFLLIGKNKFTSPTAITDKLIYMEDAVGKCIVDNGNGGKTYTLEPEEYPLDNDHVQFTFRIGKEIIPQAEYDKESHQITFPREVSADEQWSMSWFYAGCFTSDFSGCLRSDFPMNAIMDKVINILAYGTLSAWGDKEVGRVLEVRNILTDTDFTMYSPANSARAKVDWRNQMNRDMDTLVSELNWRIMSTPKGGSRFGK